MGIKDLKKTIKKYLKVSEISLNDIKGKRIAIDGNIFLYKFRYTDKSESFHIIGFLLKTIEFLERGIIPVYIFDGIPHPAKKNTLDNRKKLRNESLAKIEVLKEKLNNLNVGHVSHFGIIEELNKLNKNLLIITKSHTDDVLELFEILGIPFLRAKYDAEETCAWLQKNDKVDYILTEDTDSLVFGGSNIILSGFLYQRQAILEAMEITFPQFVDFSVLCGCDFTGTIPKVGPVTALNLIKQYTSIDNFPNEIPESFDYQLARSVFNQSESWVIDININLVKADTLKLNELFIKYKIHKNVINKINKLILK